MLRRNLVLAILFAAGAAGQDSPPWIGLTSSPAAGSGNGMFSFQATASEEVGYMYVAFVLSGGQCAFYYYPGSNTVYLLPDQGSDPMLAGTPSSGLSNHECRIETDSYWDGSSTLNVHLTFLAGFQGNAAILLEAYDDMAQLDSGLAEVGMWNTTSPLVTSFSPASGPPGTVVTIVGSNFGSSPGTVTFNGVAATAIWSWATTQILASVPSGALTGPIVVTAANGVVGLGSSAFGVAPVITSFSPTSGPPGTAVTVVGSRFGPVPYTISLWNNGAVSNDPTNAQCDGVCVDIYHPATYIFDDFTVPAGGMTITGFDYSDFFVGSALYTSTLWSIWSGDPLNGGRLVASGSAAGSYGSCNPVAANTCLMQITVSNLSVTLSTGGTYWLGTATLQTTANKTYRALAAGTGLQGYERSNGSTTGVAGSTWQPGATNLTYAGVHTAFDIFGTRNVVTFGGAPATTTSWTDTQITATVSGNAKTGPVTVIANGMTATSNGSFTVIGGDPDPFNPLLSATNIGVFRANASAPVGVWYLDLIGTHSWNSASDEFFNFGMYDTTTGKADQPVVGQWSLDAGNPLSIGVFRKGSWFLDWNNERGWDDRYDGSDSNHSQWSVISFGEDGDIPVIGDWKHDGNLHIGVVRPITDALFAWYLQTDCAQGSVCNYDPSRTAVVQWGNPGDIPVIGDWDNSGTLRIGVFRPHRDPPQDPNEGKWIVNMKTCQGKDVNSTINCNTFNFNDNTPPCSSPDACHTCAVNQDNTTLGANCWAIFSTPASSGSDNTVIDPTMNGEFVGQGGFGTFKDGTWHQQASYNIANSWGIGAFGGAGDVPVIGPWSGADFTLSFTNGSCPSAVVAGVPVSCTITVTTIPLTQTEFTGSVSLTAFSNYFTMSPTQIGFGRSQTVTFTAASVPANNQPGQLYPITFIGTFRTTSGSTITRAITLLASVTQATDFTIVRRHQHRLLSRRLVRRPVTARPFRQLTDSVQHWR